MVSAESFQPLISSISLPELQTIMSESDCACFSGVSSESLDEYHKSDCFGPQHKGLFCFFFLNLGDNAMEEGFLS